MAPEDYNFGSIPKKEHQVAWAWEFWRQVRIEHPNYPFRLPIGKEHSGVPFLCLPLSFRKELLEYRDEQDVALWEVNRSSLGTWIEGAQTEHCFVVFWGAPKSRILKDFKAWLGSAYGRRGLMKRLTAGRKDWARRSLCDLAIYRASLVMSRKDAIKNPHLVWIVNKRATAFSESHWEDSQARIRNAIAHFANCPPIN